MTRKPLDRDDLTHQYGPWRKRDRAYVRVHIAHINDSTYSTAGGTTPEPDQDSCSVDQVFREVELLDYDGTHVSVTTSEWDAKVTPDALYRMRPAVYSDIPYDHLTIDQKRELAKQDRYE